MKHISFTIPPRSFIIALVIGVLSLSNSTCNDNSSHFADRSSSNEQKGKSDPTKNNSPAPIPPEKSREDVLKEMDN